MQWTNDRNRRIILLFKKEASEKRSGSWRGWFGRMMKAHDGYWWMPSIPSSQSMVYEEKVAQFIRDRLVRANIDVSVRAWID